MILVYCQKQSLKLLFWKKKIKLANLCKILDNLFKSYIFAGIFTPVKHLVFLQKQLKPLPFFAKAPSWMYDWFPNMPLERFVQNAPRKELAIAPFTHKLAVSSTMDTSLKNKIFVDVFLIEDMSMLLYESRRSCSLLLP